MGIDTEMVPGENHDHHGQNSHSPNERNHHCGRIKLTTLICQITRVANVKRKKSIELSKGELCLYIQESLELCVSLWKLMIGNTSGK